MHAAKSAHSVALSASAIVRIMSPTIGDEALVAALRASLPGAADLLFERYGPYVETLIVRVMGLDPDVPELIQEVFARALAGLDRLRQGEALKGWIGSVAIFTARAYLRDRSTRRKRLFFFGPDELPERPAPIAMPEITEALRRTYAVLETLPEGQRIPFALRYVEGMELAEIATVCRISLATVKRRLVQAQRSFSRAADGDPLLRELVAELAREKRT